MLIKRASRSASKEADVTPEQIYLQRRHFMTGALAAATALALPRTTFAQERYEGVSAAQGPTWFEDKLSKTQWEAITAPGETITPYQDASTYNNFYEFGTGKADPSRYAGEFRTEPWTVMIDGEVGKPGRYDIESLVKPHDFEERIYRLRCVEAWSMVIPWLGFPLAKLVDAVEPTSHAKYVRFETVVQRETMPGVRSGFALIDWPYVEGLRLDEARHPLAFMAVGMYGRVLPNQNGAPLRLVVPWKYGFKGIKSIVRISFEREEPQTTWPTLAESEYGFYANVNPKVDHPRWSQARERRLPSGLFSPNLIETQMFNGYEEEVASLYDGMDLRRYY